MSVSKKNFAVIIFIIIVILSLILGIFNYYQTQSSKQFYRVVGSKIIDGNGREHIFRGIARPSLEWSKNGEKLSLADYKKMKQWGANIIRLPLNQKYWLSDKKYKTVVYQNIQWIESLGMDVILDLHSKGLTNETLPIQRMADKNSLIFWQQISDVYKNDPHVIFELYNEPDVPPDIWLNGGSKDGFSAVGMQQITDVIRRDTGANNLIIVNGNAWGFKHSELARIKGNNILYGAHPYNFPGKNTEGDWDHAFGFLSNYYPVILTELGDTQNCDGSFDKKVIDYAKKKHISWVAWAWYHGGCGFPALIENWNYDPTEAGRVIKDALKKSV